MLGDRRRPGRGGARSGAGRLHDARIRGRPGRPNPNSSSDDLSSADGRPSAGDPPADGRRAFEALDAIEQRAQRAVDLGTRSLDERELQLRARVGTGLDGLQRRAELLEDAHRGARPDALGLRREARVGVGRLGQLGRNLAERRHEQQLARAHLQVRREGPRVATLRGAARDREQHRARVARVDRVERLLQQLGIARPQDREHVLQGDLVAAVRHELLQRPQRVAEAAGRGARDRGDGLRGDRDRLGRGRAPQDARDLLDRRALEVEAVAAVHDRRRDLLRLRRRQHEDRPRRRLLERLQERVPRRRREHVGLVEDVHLAAPTHRRERHPFAQLADVVDRVVRRRVHLDHVQRARRRDRAARFTLPARLDRRPALAVQARRQDLRHRRLAGPARADEQVRVVHPPALHRVAQRPHDRLLPDHVRERPRTVAPVQRRLLQLRRRLRGRRRLVCGLRRRRRLGRARRLRPGGRRRPGLGRLEPGLCL